MVVKTESAGLPARIAAQAILSDVLRKRRPLDAVQDDVLAQANLSQRDAGFARTIVGETLRRFGQLDALIKHFVVKPPAPHRVGPVPEILLAGACELLFLDVPPHAAVDAANRLCERDNKAVHFRPLVNAVLRRVASEGKSILAKQDAARLNTPDWLWTRWCEAYGEETTRKIAAAHLSPAPLDVVVKDKAQAAQFFPDAENLFDNVFRLRDAGRVDALPRYAGGAWWVQDVAASLPARLLGDVNGQSVIDLCAAPGGKTAQLASMGANVIAVEREASRLSRITENLDRLHLNATLIESDIRDFVPETLTPFVLLDAPCSATGTMRRHPELGWIKSASDVMACAQGARELLDAAADMLAPDGILVFAVCSLEPEEGLEQITSFLESREDFARVSINADEVFGMSRLLTADGDLRTLPCHLPDGMDGFYAARLRKLR
ncbi:MAG TPA: transcription antitermination factor NusB [Rhizomicrobium sp.]